MYSEHEKHKLKKARHKLRGDRRQLFEFERALFLRDKSFKDEYFRIKKFIEEMNS